MTITLGSIWDDRERILKQIDGYLCTKTTSNIEEGLKNFPVVRELFMKFNCIRSTEAICERMFTYAGICILNVECCIVKCVIVL